MMKENFETFWIAKTWKRISARIIDIIIVSILPSIVTLIWFYVAKSTIESWWAILIVIFLNYFLLFNYFIILPLFYQGMTLGKKILQIKLVNTNNSNSRFSQLLIREIFLVFLPFTLGILVIILTGIVQPLITKDPSNQTAVWWITILTRTFASFIIAWYLGIMIVTKIDHQHQLFYDRKSSSYVVDKQPVIKKNINKINQAKMVHIHLQSNLPGVIDENELNDIKNLSEK